MIGWTQSAKEVLGNTKQPLHVVAACSAVFLAAPLAIDLVMMWIPGRTGHAAVNNYNYTMDRLEMGDISGALSFQFGGIPKALDKLSIGVNSVARRTEKVSRRQLAHITKG
jgi:hypothetical protein